MQPTDFNFIVLGDTEEGLKALREIANHYQGIATAIRKYVDSKQKTQTVSVTPMHEKLASTTNVRRLNT